MKHKLTYALAGAALLAFPTLTPAQPTAHYFPGTEGIKAASLPPPGFYLRDYNLAYYADHFNNQTGNEVHGTPRLFVYANAPRLIWITDLEVLGGNIGVDGLVPLQFTELQGPGGDRTFGIGDAFGEVTWSKHVEKFDFSLGYGIWAPTGDFAPNSTRAGLGYWGHMLTAGLTYYIDSEKKWAVSLLNRYEFNMEQDKTDITPGQAYTLEWGVSRSLTQNIEAGIVGYYQQQVTADTGGAGQSAADRDRVAAIGPEISAFCSKLGVTTSLRYLYEFCAENRFEGHTVALTLTKRF